MNKALWLTVSLPLALSFVWCCDSSTPAGQRDRIVFGWPEPDIYGAYAKKEGKKLRRQ
jgi:hypothetical protein